MRCLNDVLEKFFYVYAGYVTRYAYAFIIVPVVITALLSGGLYFKESLIWNNTETVTTPANGRARYEKRTFEEHFPLNQDDHVPGQSVQDRHYFQIVITSKNQTDNNLLKDDVLDAIEKLNQYVINDHRILGYDGLNNVTYGLICMKSQSQCFQNYHVQILKHREAAEKLGYKVRYPIFRVPADNPAYVGALLGSVKFNETDGWIDSVGALKLVYFCKHEPEQLYYYGNQFRDSLADYLKNYDSDLSTIKFAHEESMADGLQENERRFLPEIGVTISLVMLFSYICSFTFMRTSEGTFIDWVKSKPLLAVVGTMEPGLAIVTTLGLLLLLQCPYNSIVVVMPFLVFAIGVDDMFIMISSWRNTNFNDPPEKRFAEALSEAGVAITITSVTDVIAFFVGTWNPIPLLQIYCYYTAVAMFFELVYQCTFYAAALYLIGRGEAKGLHCMTWKKATPLTAAKTKFQRRFCLGTILGMNNRLLDVKKEDVENGVKLSGTEARFEYVKGAEDQQDVNASLIQTFFRKRYGPLLLKPITKCFVAVLFAVYLAFSIWGVLIMPTGLKTAELVPETHHVHQWLVANFHHWRNGVGMQVLVNNAPDLSDPGNRRKVYDMVESLENTRHTMDHRYTMLWLEEYESWLSGSNRTSAEAYGARSVREWLSSLSFPSYWKSCLDWSKDNRSVGAFRFQIGLKDYGTTDEHLEAVVSVRDLLELYPEFNMTCYERENAYVDNYLVVYSITIRNTLISLAIIIVITMFLIPHPLCGLFMTICVLSIDVGVTGFLCWWHVNMDCIAMVGMIMATGFAVDFSAHISYAYVRARGTPNERAIRALETLGWPVFQGVTATLLGVLIMGTIDAYMFQVFFKTIFLVILFGLLHSVVFLPVALTGLVPQNICCKKSEDVRLETESPVSDLSTKQVLLTENLENGNRLTQ